MYSRNAIGLGNRISDDVSNSNSIYSNNSVTPLKQLILPLLTDHGILPCVMASTALYECGFIVTMMDDIACVPVCISFPLHVDRVWIVNINDCIEHCIKYWYQANASVMTGNANTNKYKELLNHLYELPLDGLLIVFRLRNFNYASVHRSNAESADAGDESAEDTEYREILDQISKMFIDQDNAGFREDYLHNPIGNSLPFINTTTSSSQIGGGKYLAFYFNMGTSDVDSLSLSPNSSFAHSSSKSILTNLLSIWRSVFSRYSIPCYIGITDVTLPNEIMLNFVIAVDMWQSIVNSKLYTDVVDSVVLNGAYCYNIIQIPCSGYQQLRYYYD